MPHIVLHNEVSSVSQCVRRREKQEGLKLTSDSHCIHSTFNKCETLKQRSCVSFRLISSRKSGTRKEKQMKVMNVIKVRRRKSEVMWRKWEDEKARNQSYLPRLIPDTAERAGTPRLSDQYELVLEVLLLCLVWQPSTAEVPMQIHR